MRKLIKLSIVASLFLSMYACSTKVQKVMYVEMIGGVATLNINKGSGDVTLTQSDSVVVYDNEKIKYNYTTSASNMLIEFQDPSIGYTIESSYSVDGKLEGKFRY